MTETVHGHLTSVLELLASTLRVSTPLIFAALGGMVSERAGVVNIALEGMMLVGAFAAAVAASATGSPWVGALAGAAGGLLMGAVYAASVIPLRADQIVAGTAINLLATGMTPVACKVLYGSSSATPALPMDARFRWEPVALALILAGLAALWLRRTVTGLFVRFAGEKPEALDAAGVSVNGVRWGAVLASGVLAGLGGASLSIFLSSSFSRNMSAGRGFMALAALIFGRWRPVPAVGACLLFGLADAGQIRLQGVSLWDGGSVPVQFIQILPYVVTLVVLAGWVGASRAPAKLGQAFRAGGH